MPLGREGVPERFDAEARRPAVFEIKSILPSARADQGKSTPSAIGGENAVRRFLLAVLRIIRYVDRSASGVPGLTTKSAALIYRIGLLFILLGLSAHLFAQSNTGLIGRVYDKDDGSPIVGAVIELAGTGYKTISDNFGRYILENIPAGSYELNASALGYNDAVVSGIEIVVETTRRLRINMSPKIYQIDGIIVRGERHLLSAGNTEVLLRHQIEAANARDLPALLENIPGVFIQRSGSITGRSEVRIRGSDPKHVLILIDGHKINPASSGVADLSTIPLDIVERVEIYKGGSSAQFGPDALGGVINIITQSGFIRGNFSIDGARNWGPWNTDIYNLKIINPITSDKFSTRFVYSHEKSTGDFDFDYEVHPNPRRFTGTRINNSANTYNYFVSGLYIFNDRIKLNYSGQYYKSQKGLPDRANRQNEYAKFNDHRKLASISLLYEKANKVNIKSDFAFSRYVQHYYDDSILTRYDSRYTNDIFSIRHHHQYQLLTGNKFQCGAEFIRDILYHSERYNPVMSMGKTVRDDIGLFFIDEQRFDVSRSLIFDDVVLQGSWRFDYVETRKDSTSYRDSVKTNDMSGWSPKINIALSKGDRLAYVIRAAYGKSVRLPALNALFWVGDSRSHGNPGLKPERSEHSEAGLELRGGLGPVKLSGGLTYFHSFIKDLVIWQPSLGAWQPINLEKAQITGHEDFVELALFNDAFSIKYQNTITTALNKTPGNHTTYDKRLVFFPHYIQSLTADLKCQLWKTSIYLPGFDFAFDLVAHLKASYSVRRVDSTYTLTANTKYYMGYRLDDLNVGLTFDIASSWRVAVDYKLYNVRNVSYVLMTHYPMPRREWNLGLKLSYGVLKNI